jgi:4-hydroxy-tetrahydrodipicolinate synthase
MNTNQLSGVIPAMVTPANDAGDDISVERTRRLCRAMISSGVNGLFATSSTGEAPSLTRAQRIKLVETVVDEADHRIPVLAGAGSPSTQFSIEFARDAEKAGVDIIVVLPMHFVKVSLDELYGYFAAVADSVSIPTLLYNYPGRTSGQNIPPEMSANLSVNHNVIGLKDSSGEIETLLQTIAACGPSFRVFTGFETLLPAAVPYGCAGSICAAANVAPSVVLDLYRASRLESADAAVAHRSHVILSALRRLTSKSTFPAGIKAATTAVGVDVGPTFAPTTALDRAGIDSLRRALADIGISGLLD